jgi:hypothetical protein
MLAARPRHVYVDDDTDDLRRALRVNATTVARFLLGPENLRRSTRQQLRFGTGKGSLSVGIGRENFGTWFDYATNQSGDMFGLIRHVRGCSFVEAKVIARNILGLV